MESEKTFSLFLNHAFPNGRSGMRVIQKYRCEYNNSRDFADFRDFLGILGSKRPRHERNDRISAKDFVTENQAARFHTG
jgi:predicted N-acyltransferase